MKSFNYLSELQKLISSKQLVEVRIQEDPTIFMVAYILNANEDTLTLMEIAPDGTFDGVCMYLMENVDSIKVDTIYINKLMKKVKDAELYDQAMNDIEKIKKFTFAGFISTFENTSTIVEARCDNGNDLTGRVIGFDDNFLALDEFDEKNDTKLASSYIALASITRLSVDIPYLRKVAAFLAKKVL